LELRLKQNHPLISEKIALRGKGTNPCFFGPYEDGNCPPVFDQLSGMRDFILKRTNQDLCGEVTYLKESTLTLELTARKAVEAGMMYWEREMFKRSSGRIMQQRFESGPDPYRPGISDEQSIVCLSTIPQEQSPVLSADTLIL
jgi:hypothetical protein